MSDLNELRKTLTQAGVLMSFNGAFSHSIIEELGKAIKRYLEGQDLQMGALMDVFSVYIEATQNVRNYTARAGLASSGRPAVNDGIIVIGREEDRYVVSSGNYVWASDGVALGQRLDRLRDLDRAGLKALYKEQMRRKLPPEAEGAGLGLIDMARKASEPLLYSLVPVGEGLAFFSLRVVI